MDSPLNSNHITKKKKYETLPFELFYSIDMVFQLHGLNVWFASLWKFSILLYMKILQFFTIKFKFSFYFHIYLSNLAHIYGRFIFYFSIYVFSEKKLISCIRYRTKVYVYSIIRINDAFSQKFPR